VWNWLPTPLHIITVRTLRPWAKPNREPVQPFTLLLGARNAAPETWRRGGKVKLSRDLPTSSCPFSSSSSAPRPGGRAWCRHQPPPPALIIGSFPRYPDRTPDLPAMKVRGNASNRGLFFIHYPFRYLCPIRRESIGRLRAGIAIIVMANALVFHENFGTRFESRVEAHQPIVGCDSRHEASPHQGTIADRRAAGQTAKFRAAIAEAPPALSNAEF